MQEAMLIESANRHIALVAMLTPDQLRAARALVDWTREDLAERSGVSPNTVKGFERLGSDPRLSTLNKWRQALEAAGVEFIDASAKSDPSGPGVRLTREAAERQASIRADRDRR
jgi:transcriptional regulator with XRE-family HTH domain